MEALEESNEQLKNEVHELKGQIAKILETLLSLEKKASEGTPSVAHAGPSVQPQGVMGQVNVHVNRSMQEDPPEVQWPLYGLPPGYTPPVLEDQTNNNPPISQPQGSSVNNMTPLVSNQQVTPEPQTINANPSTRNAATNPQ